MPQGGWLRDRGTRPADQPRRHFCAPTVTSAVPIVHENEVFGSVRVVFPFGMIEEALTLANDVDADWPPRNGRGESASRPPLQPRTQVRRGVAQRLLAADLGNAHGGEKQNGFGHDLSRYSLEEYATLKHVMADWENETVKGWHFTILGDAQE